MKNIDLITMNEALEKYVIPDFMNGYRRLENLIMELEVEAEDATDSLLIEKKDLAAFNHIWKSEPAKFVEIIAVAWVSAVEDNILMLMRTAKK